MLKFTKSAHRNLLQQLVRSFRRAQHTNPVCSHNEWDPLEEVIVGRVEGACVPPLTTVMKGSLSKEKWQFFQENAGKRYPEWLVKKAQEEVENFCRILQSEGVKVHRPEECDFSVACHTPDFYSPFGGFNNMPRDLLLVIGDEIIEAPMSWRSRYFEYRSYRTLMKDYFSQGARWSTCPKPLMSDELYDQEYPFTDLEARKKLVAEGKYVTTEFEPCFDAADFYRVGKDIFATRSCVTNFGGIEWLRRHLGDDYKIHVISPFLQTHAKHIDTTMAIPKPGIVLLNYNIQQEFEQRKMFEDAQWKVVDSIPQPTTPSSHPMYFSSPWLSMNTLSLDTERVMIEAHEQPMIDLYEKLGIQCIKVPFRHAYSFGGGLHCYTCDIRRKGKLESYF